MLDGPDLETLVAGLNRLGVKPDGIIAILQGIKSAGALQAELVLAIGAQMAIRPTAHPFRNCRAAAVGFRARGPCLSRSVRQGLRQAMR